MKRFILFITCILFIESAYTIDTIYVDSSVKTIPVLDHIYSYIDKTNKLTIDDIYLIDDQFEKITNKNLNSGVGNRTGWVKFIIKNTSAEPVEYVMNILNPNIDYLSLIEFENDIKIREVKTGELRDISTREFFHRSFLFKLVLIPGKSYCYYIKFYSNGDSNFINLTIRNPKLFQRMDSSNEILIWLIHGLLIFIIAFNFYLFSASGDRMVLYYTLYVLFASLFTVFVDGYLVYVNLTKFTNHAKFIVPVLAVIYLTSFSQLFLDSKVKWPGLNQILNIYKYLLIATSVLYFMPYPYNLIAAFMIQIITVMVGIKIVVLSIISFNRNYLPSVVFLSSFLFMMVGVSINLFKDSGLLPSNFATNNAIRFGLFIETTLLAIAILERFRMQQKQAQKTLEADRINQAKLNFFTNVSHEFRTPLSLILAPVDSLMETENDVRKKDQYKIIRKNALQLGKLVDQVLDFRKLDVEKAALQLKNGDIIQFTKNITSSFVSLSEKQNVKLKVDSPIPSYLMYFDHEKIEKVLYNILSNAFKYTPSSGEIKVDMDITSTKPSGIETTKKSNVLHQYIIINIKDTGKGIAEEYHKEIFKPYYQAPGTEYGTGIGLAITDEYVKSHHGIIELDSRPGKGSHFAVYLPTNLEKLYPVEESEDSVIKDDKSVPNELDNRDEEEFFLQDIGIQNKSRSKILLVEDNEDIIWYLKGAFEADFTILTAENGKEALEIATSEMPDLIISDIMMPVMDGITFCRKVKTDERTSHVPVILLTAKAGEESRIEGLKHEADDYIVKPFSIKEIKARVKNLIIQRQKLRDKFTKELVKVEPGNITSNTIDEEFLKEAIAIVEQHLDDVHFTSNQLVNEMAMSRSLVYKKLKKLVGQSASQFIITIRIRAAARLLQERTYTISDLAYKVGFNDPDYFTRSFKKLFHKTPSLYMKEIHK